MVSTMEDEVKTMQKELECLQDERKNLAMVKKLLKCVEARAKQPGCLLQQQQQQINDQVQQQQQRRAVRGILSFVFLLHLVRTLKNKTLMKWVEILFRQEVCAGTDSTPRLSTVYQPPPTPQPPPCIIQLDQQLKETKQQYSRLKEDYNGKVSRFSFTPGSETVRID